MNHTAFDHLIDDVASRFGLSADKTRQLLGALVSLIFNEERGGFAGFASLFRQKGLGDLIQSWIGPGPNLSITPIQVESVFGAPLIGGLADKLGVGGSVVSGAISGLLPGLVHEVTADGREPTGLPDVLKGWATGAADWLGDLGKLGWGVLAGSAAAVGGVVTGGAAAVGNVVGNAADATADAARGAMKKAGGGGGKLLPWLLLAAALIAAILLFKGCQHDEAMAPAPDATTATDPTAIPAAQFDSKLSMSRAGGKITVEGVVDSETTKSSIVDALNQAYGAANVTANISVDPNAKVPGWLAGLAGFLPSFTADGATLSFEGNKVDLSGNLADADKAGLLDKLKAAFGGFNFGGLSGDAASAVSAVAERSVDAANAALDKLSGSPSNADDLIKALNLIPINFETASARITVDSASILEKAAAAIRAAPAGTKIEVGGHTDSDGNEAANQNLSEARAAAVVTRLGELGVAAGTLSSKGYGEGSPIADNATAEGKAKNRRIEFKVSP